MALYRAIAAASPVLARRVIFVTATSPVPTPSASSKRVAAAGSPNLFGLVTCCGACARRWRSPRPLQVWHAPLIAAPAVECGFRHARLLLELQNGACA